MDPGTQRMLERARARRQKLDEQLKSAGHKRSPLQENNVSQFVKVTTEVEVVLNSSDPVKKVNVSPTKVEVSSVKRQDDISTSPKENISTGSVDMDNNRERNIRSQLKRLGALYSDSHISSPIHRTENHFSVENESGKSGKSTARVARFAALADNIKQWEDDLSHPSCGSKYLNEPASSAKTNEEASQKKIEECEERMSKKTSENRKKENGAKLKQPFSSKIEPEAAPKKIVWDEKVLQTLEAQGFTRSCSNARLVYDYSNHSSQDTSKEVLKQSTSNAKARKEQISNGIGQIQDEVSASGDRAIMPSTSQKISGSNIAHSVSPVKKINEGKLECKKESPKKLEGNSVPGKPLGSPRKVLTGSPKAGSVLHKASLFESTSPNKKVKDPAELPISERMAFFERNKGQALIPKAAFSMPVPSKYLESSATHKNQQSYSPEKGKLPGKIENTCKAQVVEFPPKISNEEKAIAISTVESNVSNKVLSCRSIFEQPSTEKVSSNIFSEQAERQKDIEMLRNRWNQNKNLASETLDEKPHKIQEKNMPVPPPPPPLPVESGLSQAQKSFTALPQVTQMIPKSSPIKVCPSKGTTDLEIVEQIHESPKKTQDFSELCKIKKIRVSPPKPGNLYPCLSDIEVTTEAESELPDETERDSASESSIVTDSDDGNTSFGREILEAAGIHRIPENTSQLHHQKMDSSESDLSESAVLADIDGCIDEALEGYDSSSDSDQGGPTPPKRTRDFSRSPPKGKRNAKQSPNSKPSQSFRYTPGGHSNGGSPTKSPSRNISMQVVEGDQEMPLMHSVSFYRRQQNMALKNTPVRQIVRLPEISKEIHSAQSSVKEDEVVRKKIAELLDEVSKQQTVISQASQALNLCLSTVEFSGSAEQVEGERLLLLATHKRQAALHEIQRLKVEGSLKPESEAGRTGVSLDKGSLVLTNVALTLKKDYIRKLPAEDTCYHFVCLVRSQDQVLVTPVLAATSQNLQENCNLVWNSPLRLVDLYSDFKVTLEVYCLQTRKEMLPHNVKYHIGNKKETSKSWLTPKKPKQESRLIMPSIHSPAGPSAVRSPEFRMAGYVVFSLREMSRTHFTLNKVSYSSPLEGNIQLRMKSELSVDVSERGFLTMFEDISGFGAWHRRWFVLNGSVLSYWKYPDDERKIPIGQIDLNSCTTEQIGLVSRDICARPNTFLLETTRPAQPEDKDSLVVVTSGNHTVIRNLLSADTKEERIVWCGQINKALTMLRAWGKKQEGM
ncbi:hypothetical protein R5R35_001470 [Gryllus longicercus]|uniref:PH domain-containing protein n=1 Tax=Gryllus longicercus TaxID=2509291 RepID=A0AAN9Z575_9ORTH